MGTALDWIGQIADWLGMFIPRRILLDTRMAAVKWPRGKKAVALGPGVHFYWPLTTTIDTFPTVFQTDDMPSQTLVTTDGQTVVISAMIGYEIEDIKKVLTSNYSVEKMIQNLGLPAIRRVCCKLTWEELKSRDQKGTLETELRNAVKRVLEERGIRVTEATLTDLAPCRVYRMVQSTMSDSQEG